MYVGPSPEAWLLMRLLLVHLEFIYFLNTTALMLLDTSLWLCQIC